MDTSLMYKIIYYLTLIGVFLPYAVILFGFFSWIIANQTNNLKGKKKATIVVGVAIAVIYLFRFTPIVAFAAMYNKTNIGNLEFEGVTNIFTLLQLLVVAFIPAFTLIQSYIFEYQLMITEGNKRTSASSKRSYIMFGIVATIVAIIILQTFKSLFSY